MVFLERGKISKGLIKKSYPAQGETPRAEQSEIPLQRLDQRKQEASSQKAEPSVPKGPHSKGLRSRPFLHKRSPAYKKMR